MAWLAVAGLAISAAPAIYKGVKGISQSAKANAMHPINPGYQPNYGVLDNAKTLSDNYGNYQLPGLGAIAGNINTNYSDAFSNGVKGASSGNDILQLATNMAYGKNQAFNQLGVENAQGKQSALAGYLEGNAAAGQEYQNMNAYQRQEYDKRLQEKAALTQAGAENTYGAVDQLAAIGSKYAFSKLGDKTGDSTPSGGPTTGAGSVYQNGSPMYDANGNLLPVGKVVQSQFNS